MKLNTADAAWLMMETPDTPMHVGVLAILRKPRNAGKDYLNQLAASMLDGAEPVAPWNCILAGQGRRSLTPRLVEADEVDTGYHLRHSALPAPGGEKELGQMVSRLHSHALDMKRPLWEFHLIEGLENNRFAFYLKIHHALIADVNAISLVVANLATNSRQRNQSPFWTSPIVETGQTRAKFDPGSLASLGKAGMGLLRSALSRDEPGSFAIPRGAPRSTLNRQINHQRRFATQQIDRQRIEVLAEATDSTINEILTYLCGSSLRRFFKEYNALPDDPLVGIMPISLQERSERVPGNAIAGIRVALGTHIGNALERLEAIKGSIAEVRKDRESLPEESAVPYALLRSAPLFASQTPGIGRFVPPLFNLGVSNTLGAEKPLYLDGARLEAIYPLAQLMQYSALSIDCVSYAGTLNIGFTGARETLPHLQRLAVYLGKALSDLEEIVTVGNTAT
jgi:WS/DGAT/MGAT family acyltransferase